MLYQIVKYLWFIRNWDRIPKLPRGMLSSEFETFTREESRVLARLGSRDPRGIKLAMKKYGVTTLSELVEILEHQKPRRSIARRISNSIARCFGEWDHDPHRDELRQDARNAKKKHNDAYIHYRLKNALKKPQGSTTILDS